MHCYSYGKYRIAHLEEHAFLWEERTWREHCGVHAEENHHEGRGIPRTPTGSGKETEGKQVESARVADNTGMGEGRRRGSRARINKSASEVPLKGQKCHSSVKQHVMLPLSTVAVMPLRVVFLSQLPSSTPHLSLSLVVYCQDIGMLGSQTQCTAACQCQVSIVYVLID